MARSTKMQIAKSSRRSAVRSKPQRHTGLTFGESARIFTIIGGIGAAFIAYNTLCGMYGQNVVNLSLCAVLIGSTFLFIRAKLRSRRKAMYSNPIDALTMLQREALAIAANPYNAVNARNTAIRSGRELTILLAAQQIAENAKSNK